MVTHLFYKALSTVDVMKRPVRFRMIVAYIDPEECGSKRLLPV